MSGGLTIKRKPDNGGDKVYSAIDELYADFASMSLHPGDLKPAIKDAGTLVFLEGFWGLERAASDWDSRFVGSM